MKHLLFTFFSIIAFAALSQNYTWMHGSALNGNIAGAYGVMGASAPANDPGSRHGAARWTDLAGNLWLFGGEGHDAAGNFGWLNDLWKYTVSTNQWTWIGGSNAINQQGTYTMPGSQPGAREFPVTWTNASGDLFLFGGDGFAASPDFGRLGDLWQYNIALNRWTFLKGFTVIDQGGIYGTMGVAAMPNMPGARYGGTTWRDASGNLLLFGGKGFDAGGTDNYLNDLWKYDQATQQWTWLKGSDLVNQFSVYGTLGTPASGNCPGGREFPAAWSTASGELYLFGGFGFGATISGYLNDLWKYNTTTNAWTWVNGSQATNQPGVYGTQGTDSPLNMPGGRHSPCAWKDDAGNFWLFGGLGFSSTTTAGRLNDLFKYNYCTNTWTWMKGANTPGLNGTYGTMGIPASANTPGARSYNNFWTGTGNTFWIMGGLGYSSTGIVVDNMNDLWKFEPPCAHSSAAASSGTSVCSGGNATLSLPAPCEGAVQWYASPGATSAIGSGPSFTTPALSAVGSPSVYTFYAQAASCTTTPRAAVNVTVNSLPQLSFSPALCNGIAATLTASGANTYTWNQGIAAPTLAVLPAMPAFNYTLSGTDANGCASSSITSVPVHTLPVINVSSTSPQVLCAGNPATLTATGTGNYFWHTLQTTPSIIVTPSVTASYSVTGIDNFGCYSTTVIVQAAAAPATLSVTAGALCDGAANTITAHGAVSYTWNLGSVYTPTLAVLPAAPVLNYILEGIDANGCASSLISTIAVNGRPAVTVTSSHPLGLCTGNTATLTANGAGSYAWSNSQTGSTITVAPQQTNTYTVTGTDTYGCINTAVITQTLSPCVGMASYAADKMQVKLYPNPNNGVFTLSVDQADGRAILTLFSSLGQQVFEQAIDPGNNYIMPGLTKGIYYYRLTSVNNQGTAGGILLID